MEAGDFDVTPAPSGRPSRSVLRDGDAHGSASTLASPTGAAGVRHHLLKTSASGPTIIDRDLPAPFILYQAPAASDTLVPSQAPTIEPENKSVASISPLAASHQALGQGNSPSLTSQLVAHPAPSGLLYHVGGPGQPFQPTNQAERAELGDYRRSATRPHPSSSPLAVLLREASNATDPREPSRRPAASGEGIHPGHTRTAALEHSGRSRVSKVRPAFHYDKAHHPVMPAQGHGVDYRPSRNKVGPFDAKRQSPPAAKNEELMFFSGSSTAVSLRGIHEPRTGDSSAPSIAATASSDMCRGRFPKVQAAVEIPEREHFLENSMSLVAPLVAPSNALGFSTSKVRPFVASPDRPDHASSYSVYESKARPMTGSKIPEEQLQVGGMEFRDALPSLSHEAVRIPVAKPYIDTPLDAVGSRRTHHHHISKAQAFTGGLVPSAFPTQGALDQCQRCQRPEDVEEQSVPVQKTVGDGAAGHPSQMPSKHSISVCDEYPTYPGPEPHSMDMCQSFSPFVREGQKGVSEQHSQYMTPLPSRTSPVQHQVAQTSPLLRMSSPTRYGQGLPIVDPESPAQSLEDYGFVTNAVFGAPSSRERAYFKPAHGYGQSKSSGFVEGFIHAPIPVSKVRPAFQDHALGEYYGHTPVSKTRVAEDSFIAPTPDNDRRLDPESGQVEKVENDSLSGEQGAKASEGSPGRHRLSLGSALDYKRTAHWLRDVLNNRESYITRFTERPAKIKHDQSSLPEQRRKSESMLSNILSARPLTKNSSQISKKSARFDGHVFRRAVNDLEKLLNEALSIASHVVDRPETPARGGYKPPSSLRSHRRSVSSNNDDSEGSLVNLVPARAQETGGSMEDVELDDVSRPQRPTCRHAATYSGLYRRPRLNEILQSYSSEDVETKVRQPARNIDRAHEASPSGPKVSFEVPCRGSSRHMKAYAVTRAEKCRFSADGGSESSHFEAKHHGPSSHTRETVVQHPEPNSRHGHAGAGEIKRATGQRVARGGHVARRDAGRGEERLPERDIAGRPMHAEHGISLRRRSHVSLRGAAGFNLARSRRRQPTARDWSPVRKRFVAAVACTSTALIGVILGIYAGLVPSIQYYIIDQSHATVHGNTGCFLGLAVPTFFLWPLPLLHGRKPYILTSLMLAMPLLFPQALAVNSQRLTNTQSWRSMLLVARTLMGASLGFASMNFHSILTDLFGASLMSVNPHQEVVDQYDARRHGGGMGAWLGIWTWCWIGSLGVGFLVGACIIDNYPPAWGFYVSIVILAVVLILNIVSPEVRRSAFRRSIAEVRTGSDISRRIARGEVMMHRIKTGPKWWGQEVYHGLALSLEMLRQPGFAVLTLYSAWIYAQVVLVIVLLGSLASRLYQLRSPKIGLLVGSMALGACLAIPFQKANVFSRSRQAQMNNNLATLNRRVAWSSHLVRRTVFTLLLPLAGICYAAVSSGPPLHISVPTMFAGFVGFLSCLAIAECNGLVMETFDCSDLSSGMVGRQHGGSAKDPQKRTNYSSFPRVTAGFAAIHGLAFVLAAGATALGGLVTRTLGQQVATGVVAGILFLLTVLLLLVLIRFKEVQIIPQCKSEAMDKLVEARRRSSTRRASMPNDPLAIMEEEMAWRPVMIGNPTGKKRRMNVLELGGLARWNEIRKKNKLIDEGAHLNRAAWDQGMEALDDQMSDLQRDAREFFGMGSGRSKGMRRLRHTDEGSETADESIEMENMEMSRAEDVPHGQLRRHPDRCAMSQTGAEQGEDKARRTRRRH